MAISLLSRIIDTLVPATCVICGSRLASSEEFVCAKCNLRFPRTGFETNPYENTMAKMFWGKFHIEKCAALITYSPHSKSADIILSLKYHKHPDYGFELGRFLAIQFLKSGFFEGITAIMPVPLAANRERKRGYNQSREIARGICFVTRLPLIDKAVKRSKFIDTQTHKTRDERRKNVENSFTLIKPEALRGQHVLLVDDVATTGATITACATEMEKAGSVQISVATAAYAGQ